MDDKTWAGLAPPPKGSGPAWHTDDQERNLCFKVTPTGARSWWFYGRVDGRPKRIQLGTFPEIDYDEAVRRCVRVRAALYDGLDPQAVVTEARPRRGSGVTLGALWEMYGERYGKMKRKGWKQDDQAFNLYCSEIRDVRVDQLTPDRLGAWHRKVGVDHGESVANRTLNTLRAVFNRAEAWTGPDGRPIVTRNPAVRRLVPRFDEDDRDRYLDAEELRDFLRVLADHDSADCRHFFQLALFTAARKSSLMAMAFGEIDATAWVWNIPRGNFKGQKRGHTVPVLTQAQHILNLRRELYPGRWVFPGRRRGDNHIANVTRWWEELVEASKIEDIRIHDLRRTTASWMAINGTSEAIIAQFLGHKRQGVTAIYARLDTTSVRRAAQEGVNLMLRSAGVVDSHHQSIVLHRTMQQAGEA